MDVRDFFKSAFALKAGLWMGRHMHPRTGHAIADLITWAIARRTNSRLCRTIRVNLRVVLGPETPDAVLEPMLRNVIRHAGHAYFDLYHMLALGPEAIQSASYMTPQAESFLQEGLGGGRGLIVVGTHMSNFDLAALSFGTRGVPAQMLAWADPTGGYKVQNQIRQSGGFDLTPIDAAALRKAVRNLRAGGLVTTGIDRPDPSGLGDRIEFFGLPARMPMGHVRLALQTGSPIMVAMCEYRPSDRRYVVHSSPPLEMEQVGTRQENVLHNTARILRIIEGYIRARPDQWLMFYPVWHEDQVDDPSLGELRRT